MTTQLENKQSYNILTKIEIDKTFDLPPSSIIPLRTDLPTRRSVPTYLAQLDKYWHGGWSWQWPLVIAGPVDGGKTQFLYQLLTSSLLSFPSPWKIIYCDLAGDYRPDRVQSILSWRTQGTERQYQLGRVDKLTLQSMDDFSRLFSWNMRRPDVALWVIDALEHLMGAMSFSKTMQMLAEFGRRRRVGIIVTIRGSINEIRPQLLWSDIPFFLYISRKKHLIYRLRVWANGPLNQVYDRLLKLQMYFLECRWW